MYHHTQPSSIIITVIKMKKKPPTIPEPEIKQRRHREDRGMGK